GGTLPVGCPGARQARRIVPADPGALLPGFRGPADVLKQILDRLSFLGAPRAQVEDGAGEDGERQDDRGDRGVEQRVPQHRVAARVGPSAWNRAPMAAQAALGPQAAAAIRSSAAWARNRPARKTSPAKSRPATTVNETAGRRGAPGSLASRSTSRSSSAGAS